VLLVVAGDAAHVPDLVEELLLSFDDLSQCPRFLLAEEELDFGGLWEKGIAERYELAPRSAVPLLDQALIAHAKKLQREAAEEVAAQQRLRARTPARSQSRDR
jgi:hypothetical protein